MMTNTLILALAAILFCIIHSLTATVWVKAWVKQIFGEGFYNRYYLLIYSLLSVITVGGVLVYNHSIQDQTLWRIEPAFPFYLLQALGLGIVIWSSRALNFLEFFGISQALKRKPSKESQLVTTGAYGLCRHPMYLGIIIFIWTQPKMSLNYFTLVVIATLYFYLGSIPEEKKLELEFGEQYRQYKQQTHRILPTNWMNRS